MKISYNKNRNISVHQFVMPIKSNVSALCLIECHSSIILWFTQTIHTNLRRDRGCGGTIITLAKELPQPILVFTFAEETTVAVRWISSLVDDSSSLAIAVTATVLVAASLSQGSHSQEEQTQAEHHRSLHVWIVQMVLRWRDPNKWSGLGEAHLLIPKLSRATTLPETLWPSDPLTLWPSDRQYVIWRPFWRWFSLSATRFQI